MFIDSCRAYRCSSLSALFSVLMLFSASSLAFEVEETFLLEGIELTDALQAGGYIIYFRHTTTDHTQVDTNRTDLSQCENQRGLSQHGIDEATAIGLAFRLMRLPVAEVLSSPYCRCKDTAKFAFGEYKVNQDLMFNIASGEEETARLRDELRLLLAKPPVPGKNTVIISHTANLKEAADIWPSPEGLAVIFRPVSADHIQFIAKVSPEEWPGLAVMAN